MKLIIFAALIVQISLPHERKQTLQHFIELTDINIINTEL
jgi:hypothetical protein